MLLRNKKPKMYYAHHFNDHIPDLGYDYHKHVFKKTMSPAIFANEKTANMILRIEDLIDYLIDAVKLIPLHYSIAHDKDSININ